MLFLKMHKKMMLKLGKYISWHHVSCKQPDVKGIFQVFEFKWKDSQSRCYNGSGVLLIPSMLFWH